MKKETMGKEMEKKHESMGMKKFEKKKEKKEHKGMSKR